MRRPNLFCIGAMKSGTTYFTKLLGSHPQIFVCSPREPCFFADPHELRRAWPYMWQLGLWRSKETYLQLFTVGGEAKYLCDASTPYSESPIISNVAPRIHEFAPDARILYVMRDPIARTISHYWHMVRWQYEFRSPLRAIRHDPYYTAVSHYAQQLAPYIEFFGSQRVYALTYEQLVASPVKTLQSVYAWLGIDSAFIPPDADKPENVTPEIVEQARAFGWLKRLRETALWARLCPYVPGALRARLAKLAVRSVRAEDISMTSVVQYLRPIQRAQTLELSRLLGRTFPEWTSLGELGAAYEREPASGPADPTALDVSS
jgi:hypothetical protein